LNILRVDHGQALRIAAPRSICCLLTDLLNIVGGFDEAVDLVGVDIFHIVVVYLHEGVLEYVARTDPLVRLLMEQFLQEEPGRGRHVVGELQLVEPNRVVQLLVILAFEGELAAQQREQEHAQRPDISRWARVLDLSHDFGSHIRGCTAEKLNLLFMRDAGRETKVNQLDSLLRLIEQDVFQLDVSVSYIALMTVVDGLDDLAP